MPRKAHGEMKKHQQRDLFDEAASPAPRSVVLEGVAVREVQCKAVLNGREGDY